MSGIPLADVLVQPPPGLGPERRAEAWDEARVRAAAARLNAADERTGDLLLALTLLWHDHLDAAHALVQAREGDSDADWIHAVLHRREPDPGNSRYWFHQVGDHPGFASLAAAATARGLGAALAPAGRWKPDAFIAACSRKPQDPELVAIQAEEFASIARRLLADGAQR